MGLRSLVLTLLIYRKIETVARDILSRKRDFGWLKKGIITLSLSILMRHMYFKRNWRMGEQDLDGQCCIKVNTGVDQTQPDASGLLYLCARNKFKRQFKTTNKKKSRPERVGFLVFQDSRRVSASLFLCMMTPPDIRNSAQKRKMPPAEAGGRRNGDQTSSPVGSSTTMVELSSGISGGMGSAGAGSGLAGTTGAGGSTGVSAGS